MIFHGRTSQKREEYPTTNVEFTEKKVDPKTDIVFKRIFGTEENKPLLLSLLNAVLQRSETQKIEEIELLNPYMQGEALDEKVAILDIKARDEEGKWYNIEMQIGLQTAFTWRILHYWARLYSSQLRRGKEYDELESTISIIFTDFMLFDETDSYHSVFQIRERDEGFLLNEALEIHVLELQKYQKALENAEQPIEKWLAFLKEGERMQLEQIAQWDEEHKKALEEIEHLSQDPEFKWVYESRLKAINDYYSGLKSKYREGLRQGLKEGKQIGIEVGREEGREEGRKEGREEGREEGHLDGVFASARMMLEAGISTEEVASILKLSIEDVETLPNQKK